jgi:hypothetical protein
MKPITDRLKWPMTEDIERVLTNLSSEKKLELAAALIQAASEEQATTARAIDSLRK